MPDYLDTDFTTEGYYLVTYDRTPPPAGPYATVADMAKAHELRDYPATGYVVWCDTEGVTNVPSLNPDELLFNPDEIIEGFSFNHPTQGTCQVISTGRADRVRYSFGQPDWTTRQHAVTTRAAISSLIDARVLRVL